MDKFLDKNDIVTSPSIFYKARLGRIDKFIEEGFESIGYYFCYYFIDGIA